MPAFFDWRVYFPAVGALLAAAPAIAAELRAADAAAGWTAWPETALYVPADGQEWTVIPFCYTYPSDDAARTEWVASSSAALPATAAALRAVPGLRTALLSRLGPRTTLAPHQGWAELANHVLRVHVPIALPLAGCSGVTAGGETRAHVAGEALVFDDSRVHSAFNSHHAEARTVLICDLPRPAAAPRGVATGGATREFESFMAYFRN